MILKCATAMMLFICTHRLANEAPASGLPSLSVELSAEATIVKQGFPLSFRITIRNSGSEPLVYKGIQAGFWRKVSLFHQIDGEEGEPRRIGLGDPGDCNWFPVPGALQPEASLTINQPLSLYRREGPHEEDERNSFIPVTASLGSHSFWVESRIGDDVVKSAVVKVKVLPPEKREEAAFKFLLDMPGIGDVYYGLSFPPENLKNLRVLAFDMGNNGYADLARMQLAEWHLLWAMKKDQNSAVVATGLSPEDCLERGRFLINMIDTDSYPIPSRVRAIRKRLLEVEKALLSTAKK